jgi:pimeloyl-ACP methyl ester carboxylesterase
MRVILEPAQTGVIAPVRVLLLPAAYTAPEDFQREGFVRAVRERSLPLDLELVELKLQHLTDRTILRRLHHEIVLPARAMGCRTIWLGGISLGGFVSIAYAERYPQEIDGLCLLAPYLGNHIVTSEIERANGVMHWTPGALTEDDDERRIWRFIKEHGSRLSPLHLGFGQDDRFRDSHRLMAAALSPESIDLVSGGHEWPTWLRLWENFLDKRLSLPKACPSHQCPTR